MHYGTVFQATILKIHNDRIADLTQDRPGKSATLVQMWDISDLQSENSHYVLGRMDDLTRTNIASGRESVCI